MKKFYPIIIGSILITVVVVVLFWSRSEIKISPQQEETQQLSPTPSRKIFETQTNNEGGVTIEVVPKNIREGTFVIILNTHSVELNDDLTKIAVLRDENGNVYKPINWEGAPPGGHHREGILKFGQFSSMSKKIELIISGIGGIPERKFLWTTLP